MEMYVFTVTDTLTMCVSIFLGQLTVLLSHVIETTLLEDSIISDIRTLRDHASDISSKATPFIQETQPQYFNREYQNGC